MVRGQAAGAAGHVDDALDWAERAQALAPDRHGPVCLRAQCGMALKDARAQALLEAALQTRRCPSCLIALAGLREAAGDRESALTILDEAIRRSGLGSNATARVHRGVLLARSGRIEDALADWEHQIALDPRDAAAHLALVNALGRLDRYDEAFAAAVRAREQAGANPRLLCALASLYNNTEQASRALEAANEAVALDEHMAGAHGCRGKALERMGEFALAEAAFRRALELDPTSSEWAMGVGVLLYKQQKFKEALTLLDKAKEQAPKDAWVLVRRADTLLRLEQFEGARSDALAATRAGLGYCEDYAWSVLGDAQWGVGQTDDALHSYERALSLAQTPRWTHHLNLGIAYLAAGRDADAQTAFAAVERLGAPPEALADVAGAYVHYRPDGDGAILPPAVRRLLPQARAEASAAPPR